MVKVHAVDAVSVAVMSVPAVMEMVAVVVTVPIATAVSAMAATVVLPVTETSPVNACVPDNAEPVQLFMPPAVTVPVKKPVVPETAPLNFPVLPVIAPLGFITALAAVCVYASAPDADGPENGSVVIEVSLAIAVITLV
jgi:hypothetical protein